MRTVSKVCFTAALLAATVIGSVRTAQADIIVLSSVSNSGTSNVLLTSSNVGLDIIHGSVDGFDVFFESDSGNLLAPSSGQARVSAGPTNDPFTNLFFYLGGGETFTKAVFNLNSAVTGDMTIRVTGINIDGGVFEELVAVGMNGENFFTVSAINEQFISQIELIAEGDVEFEDLRQIRLGGFDDGGETVTAVPEPASMVLFGSGLAGFAAARKRRNARR